MGEAGTGREGCATARVNVGIEARPGSRRCPDSSALGVRTEAAVVEMTRTSVRLPPDRLPQLPHLEMASLSRGCEEDSGVLAGSWRLQLPHTLHHLQASKFTNHIYKKNPGVSERALLVHI